MSFVTVSQYVTHEIVIEKSRFIAHVFPVPDEDTAKDHIHTISKKHWDATHNCYAYRIGETGHIQKANDDGEPSGTAGVPILEVIKKNGLTDTLIIVTRYFGGVKLGAGGLVRAYTRSASEGLQQAQLLRQEEHLFVEINSDYATWSRIEQQLNALGLIHDRTYTDTVTVLFSLPKTEEKKLTQFLDKWGNTPIQCKPVKTDWVPAPLSDK